MTQPLASHADARLRNGVLPRYVVIVLTPLPLGVVTRDCRSGIRTGGLDSDATSSTAGLNSSESLTRSDCSYKDAPSAVSTIEYN